MSAPGRYLSPLHDTAPWSQFERRSTAPIARLSRRLDRLCLEASDHYEIAAHLEALGLNEADTCREYGSPDHFDLAKRLFELTPRRLHVEASDLRPEGTILRQLVVVFTLLVTIAIGLAVELKVWAPVLLLMIWSQLGSGLVGRSKAELDADEQSSLVSVLITGGLSGLAILWFLADFGLASWTVSLLWLTVAALLWSRRIVLALFPPLAITALLVLNLVDGIELGLVLAAGAASSLAFTLPALERGPTSAIAEWMWKQRSYSLQLALYGSGQGLIMFGLLQGMGEEALPGLLLFAAALLAFEPLLLRFRERLSVLLWRSSDSSSFVHEARAAFMLFGFIYLSPLLVAVALWRLGVPPDWLPFLFEYALFALATTLAVTLLSLRELRLPAVVFVAGGVASFVGAPLVVVLCAVAAVQLIAMWWHLENLGSYGIHIV